MKGGGAVITAQQTTTITTCITEWVILYSSMFLLCTRCRGCWGDTRFLSFLLSCCDALRGGYQSVDFLQKNKGQSPCSSYARVLQRFACAVQKSSECAIAQPAGHQKNKGMNISGAPARKMHNNNNADTLISPITCIYTRESKLYTHTVK